MKIQPWFFNPVHEDDLAKKHREAYMKSLKSKRPIKVHAGEYYYRGFEVSNDGGRECPWNYGRPEEDDHGSAETKALCIQYIDDVLKGETT